LPTAAREEPIQGGRSDADTADVARIFGPEVSEEMFLAEIERTPGVWRTRGFRGRPNMNTRRYNMARLVVAVPGLALLVTGHPIAGGIWFFATLLLVAWPVAISDVRRIRIAAAARTDGRAVGGE
jgi:hypothetical protein